MDQVVQVGDVQNQPFPPVEEATPPATPPAPAATGDAATGASSPATGEQSRRDQNLSYWQTRAQHLIAKNEQLERQLSEYATTAPPPEPIGQPPRNRDESGRFVPQHTEAQNGQDPPLYDEYGNLIPDALLHGVRQAVKSELSTYAQANQQQQAAVQLAQAKTWAQGELDKLSKEGGYKPEEIQNALYLPWIQAIDDRTPAGFKAKVEAVETFLQAELMRFELKRRQTVVQGQDVAKREALRNVAQPGISPAPTGQSMYGVDDGARKIADSIAMDDVPL